MIPEGLLLRFTAAADGDQGHPDSRFPVLSALGRGPEDLVRTGQVHGARVARVGRAEAGGPPLAGTDGLVTAEPGVVLMAIGADCPLVALHDPLGPGVAVFHAGWRGIRAGIPRAALAALAPSRPESVRAWLSPCAGPCCYEVGEEVAGLFPSHVVVPGRGGHPHLDLPAAVEWALGLPVDRSHFRCTICDAGFFSYRRLGLTGHQAVLAALAPRNP